MRVTDREPLETTCDAVVVGAGFAGLYLHHLLREQGLTVVGFDAAGDVGGTWWWNRYPGARCDIESWDYSFSFSPELELEWTWSERYAAQPEILRYLDHVADRFDLRRDISFDTRVRQAVWDEASSTWTVTTDRGDEVRAQFAVMAIGCLSEAKTPELPGIDTFAGETVYTARWPQDPPPDLTGKRVGVIGTGSSGIQCIPVIAQQAAHLTVFQRTPSYALPAHNRPLDAAEVTDLKSRYREHRELARQSHGGIVAQGNPVSAFAVTPAEREAAYAQGWASGTLFGLAGAFNDLMIDAGANETVADFVRRQIRSLVHDPAVASALTPTTYPFGARRNCLDTGYYETYNLPHVQLVNLREDPIVELVPEGIRTISQVHELDLLVFATGFDAITGPLLAFDIRGRDGLRLKDAWADGPVAYLGVSVAGFPNLFTITGPGSPSVLTNMVASIEQHVEWVADCISHLRKSGKVTVESTAQAQEQWTEHVAQVADFTLYPQADTWYTGANIPGKRRMFLPYIAGLNTFRQVCDEVAADGYRGFDLT